MVNKDSKYYISFSIVHYSIEKKIDGQYTIADGMAFTDPVALIHHYQMNQCGFVTNPRFPCSRSSDQKAVAFRGLSYNDLHSLMKDTAKSMVGGPFIITIITCLFPSEQRAIDVVCQQILSCCCC